MTQTWIVPVDTPSLARFGGLLSAAESAHAARFHRRADRERFAVGRGALRALLGRALGIDPRAVQLTRDASGRPQLVRGAAPATSQPASSGAPAALDFNISHAGRVVAIALSHGARVGVDVEQVRSLHDLASIAALACGPAELGWLQALPRDARSGALIELWTAKEACLKAAGCGLATEPSRVEVALRGAVADGSARLPERCGAQLGAERFALRRLPCPAGYRLALARLRDR